MSLKHYPRWGFFFFFGMVAILATAAAEIAPPQTQPANGLRLATFDIDASPPIGSRLAYDPVTNVWDLGLRARGVVLLGAGSPIVLCAIDWIGIANESHDAFRQTLANAAKTIPARVAVHTVHQHDAPECDFGAERIMKEAGLDPLNYEGSFARELLRRLETAVSRSLERAQPITHLGLGAAQVYQVASNRRLLGPDGRVRATRYTTCKDPALRAEPEGTIDPIVSLVSFWNAGQPVAVLSYYAVHPQSYYRTGVANPDFPGVARFFRQLAVPAALHVHFNGAGGNVGAGKYNDGAPENRLVLAERLADGMKRAWEATRREPITVEAVAWTVEPVVLPPAQSLEKLQAQVRAGDASVLKGVSAGRLEYLRRCQAGHQLEVGCLTLGRARILHLPGELFVEYQLAAKAERPDCFVAMAAYGDYGPGYVCTAIAYEQGGYEASPESSNVTPAAEKILLAVFQKLLQAQR
jgi:hypothetical protein